MKQIKTLEVKPSELNHGFGNPRNINQKEKEELKKSIIELGNFGSIVIDEKMQIISGNQRIKCMKELNIDVPVLCKQLIGYTETEKKIINIRSNKSSGEFNEKILNEWLNEINIEIEDISLTGFSDIEIEIKPKIKEVELKPYNKIHILLSIDVDKIDKYHDLLKKIYNCEGIEVEQSQN